jgi:pimeloyl-ACP methyl ester carboxylesterase
MHRALLGLSQGVAVSIAYAVRHPERVSHLVLYGGYAVGANKYPNLTEADRERLAALRTLVKVGWGSDDPTFRQIFTSSMMPSATKEQAQAFNELQRLSGSAEVAVRYIDTTNNIDIRPLLSKVTTPTLIMHPETTAVFRSHRAAIWRLEYRRHVLLLCPDKTIFFSNNTLACPCFFAS